MFLNVSGKTQCLENRFKEYKAVGPNEIISEYVFSDVNSLPNTLFKRIKSIDFSNVNSILLKRGHALGDVIMTFPIVNYLKSMGKKVYVYTNTKYVIPGVDFILRTTKIYYEDYDLVIDLDSVLERDHYEKEYFSINRVDIYSEYLNLGDIGNNWNVDFPNVDIDIEDAVVGVQLKGSTKAKVADLMPLLNELEKRGIKFYVIDELPFNNYKNAVVKRADIVGLLNIFRQLRGVLVFDSGPLWLSHVTNTPAFVIVGPTCGEKITTRHPNKLTTYYDIKDDYGCIYSPVGCGEGGDICGGRFSCMKSIKYKRLKKEFFDWMEGL